MSGTAIPTCRNRGSPRRQVRRYESRVGERSHEGGDRTQKDIVHAIFEMYYILLFLFQREFDGFLWENFKLERKTKYMQIFC